MARLWVEARRDVKKPSDRIVQNSNLKLSLKLSSTYDLDKKDDDNTALTVTVSCKRHIVSSTSQPFQQQEYATETS